jgi:hypothetical protein
MAIINDKLGEIIVKWSSVIPKLALPGLLLDCRHRAPWYVIIPRADRHDLVICRERSTNVFGFEFMAIIAEHNYIYDTMCCGAASFLPYDL